MTYICKRCGKDKPESEYYWRVRNGKRQLNGARCKSCIREVERERSAQQLSQKHVRGLRPLCHRCGRDVSQYLWVEHAGHCYCYDCGTAIRDGRRSVMRCNLCGRETEVPMTWCKRVYCPDCYPLILEAEEEYNAERLTMKRSDCKDTPRPCAITHCPYNLANDHGEHALTHTGTGCAADILDEEPWGHTLDEIGVMMGITRERVRQIQVNALGHVRQWCADNGVDYQELSDAMGNWDMEEDSWFRAIKQRRASRERTSPRSACTSAAQGDGA